ncbi:MAG TPA: tetratricopeptide repeat protein [Acidimicrobiales bacterium]|nr:tetratricopeptide repeat protein [Acidimicrobiales bacterium]
MSLHTRASRSAPVAGLTPSQPAAGRPSHARALDSRRVGEGPRHNLPHLASSFVGRQGEVAGVEALLADSRLVTLTGPGGMGKTRMAIQVALELAPRFSGGVWMVELAPVSEASLVPDALAAVVPGVKHLPGRPVSQDLVSHVGEQAMLIVVDNCEHLVEACGDLVDRLLRSCPALRVLATSREPLAVSGEHRWSVGALSLPDPAQADAASVKASEAGQLFLQRATASRPGFRLNGSMARTVAEICRRLDGVPLAIELAASRMASLSPKDLLDRLDDPFRLLTTRSRTVVARHRTLVASLEWSHELLLPGEAALLRRVSVFAGWTLEAAQEVCAGSELDQSEVLDHLEGLAGKSLVVVDHPDDCVRYRLLGMVRRWASAKLEAASEAGAISRRQALWCLSLAERAEQGLRGCEPHEWLDRLDAEEDNLRAALVWSRTTGDPPLGVKLVTTLAPFWRRRGHLGEGLFWLEWAVSISDGYPLPLRARLLRDTGLFRGMLGDTASALPLMEESSALFAQAGDHDASLCACNALFHMFDNPRQSLARLEEDIERCRFTGDTNKLSHFLCALGHAHFRLGDLPAARSHFEECVELGRGQPDGEALGAGLLGIGRVAVLLGELGVAETAFEEARTHAEQMADVEHLSTALVLLADLAGATGDRKRAGDLLDQSMTVTNADGTPIDQARGFYFLARLAEAQGIDEGEDGAGELFDKALSTGRASGAPGFHEIRCLLGVGRAAQAGGATSAAAGHFLEALATSQDIGDAHAQALALEGLSSLARMDGRFDEASTLAHRALELHRDIGDVAGIAAALESVAGLAVEGSRWRGAARLFAAAQGVLEEAGFVRAQRDQERQESDLAEVRKALGDEEFERAWVEGSSMSREAAVAYAMKGRGGRERPTSGWDGLTPAERQVAALVGEGLTNPEVGKRLFISARTVGHHLAHIYPKLGIRSRAALIKQLADQDHKPDLAGFDTDQGVLVP